jgi:hypothetical protein
MEGSKPYRCILQIFAIPMYSTVRAVTYGLAGQNLEGQAVVIIPVVLSNDLYDIVFPTRVRKSLVFGHTSVNFILPKVPDLKQHQARV